MPDFNDLPRGLPGTHESQGKAERSLWMDPNLPYDSGTWAYDERKLFLGVDIQNRLIGLADNRHLITVAGSRAGKGTSVILPNLLMYEGSMLVLDPKGENANETAERRGKGRGIKSGGLGHDVYVIDPFGTADEVPDDYRASFNPISILDPKHDNFVDDCDSIADALVVTTGNESTTYFNDMAQFVIRGFIAWVAQLAEPEKRTLEEVHRLIMQPEEDLDVTLAEMAFDEDAASSLPASVGKAIGSMHPEKRTEILSTTRQHLMFLESPPMARALSNTARQPDIRAWKMGRSTIYLCLPAGRLHRHNRFFRLFLNQLLGAVEDNKGKPEIPAVMILDEMHVLGFQKIMATSAALIAGFGVRIWSIWQDFNQLESIYDKNWETFVANSSVFQSFGLNDTKTLKYVSERLGVSSVQQISQSQISMDQRAGGFDGQSQSIQKTPLLTHDEVAYHFSRQSNNQLIIYPGTSPMWLRRLPYFHDYFKDMRPQK